MARYFMHLRDDTDDLLDPDGLEYLSLDDLRGAVLDSARDLMAGDVRSGVLDLGFRLDAEDEAGAIVFTLPFEHAVQIIRKQGQHR